MSDLTRSTGPALFYTPSFTGTENCLLMAAAEEPGWGRPVSASL